MNSVVALFRERYPEFEKLALKATENKLHFGSDAETELVLTESQDSWTVYAGSPHAHCDNVAEALTYVVDLLRSELVSIEEFRENDLARTWFEDLLAKEFRALNPAIYLSPFDPDDWKTWPDEVWRTIRSVRAFDAKTGEIALSKSESDTNLAPRDSMNTLTWMNEGLGMPAEGLKWIIGAHRRFVLQAPAGWRMHQTPDGEESNYQNYIPQSQEFVFRVGAMFRDSEEPFPVEEGKAFAPKTIERSMEDQNEQWWAHHWRPMFSNGGTEMMGLVYLYFRPGENEKVEPYRMLIDGAIDRSLMAPTEWDMKTTDW